MSVRGEIEAGVRSWLVLAGAAGGVPSADAAVVFADEDAPRPPLPYLTVRVIAYDVPLGEDQDLVDDSVIPLWRGRGDRTSLVSINAFGAGAEGWLERARFMLRAPSVLATLSAAGLTVRPESGLRNLSSLLDDHTEVRFQADFAVDYRRIAAVDETDTLTELEQVVHEDTWQSDAPADRVVTITEVL